MPRIAPNLPAESDLLCEACGYTLNGLPQAGNCPECGKPMDFSLAPSVRQLSAWERDRRFFATTAEVVFRPTLFFRTTTTRADPAAAVKFGEIHTAVASALFAAAALLHLEFLEISTQTSTLLIDLFVWLFFTTVTATVMVLVTRLAARLTTWEANYRGFRLPLPVVRRGLAFHSAHYLPIAILAVATTGAYQVALHQHEMYWRIHWQIYLGVLSGEVVLGAMYLFVTYWIAMRNMMYANQ